MFSSKRANPFLPLMSGSPLHRRLLAHKRRDNYLNCFCKTLIKKQLGVLITLQQYFLPAKQKTSPPSFMNYGDDIVSTKGKRNCRTANKATAWKSFGNHDSFVHNISSTKKGKGKKNEQKGQKHCTDTLLLYHSDFLRQCICKCRKL